MRWISYFILAYITLGLQTGLAQTLEIKGASPNLVLLTVIFISINAPREAALMGCFILGALQDLTTQGTLGLYAFIYGVVSMLVSAAQGPVYRQHPATHFVLGLIGGLITAGILAIHGRLRPAGQVHPPVMPLFYGAIYTAILAPVVIGLLGRIRRVFRFQGRGSERMRA